MDAALCLRSALLISKGSVFQWLPKYSCYMYYLFSQGSKDSAVTVEDKMFYDFSSLETQRCRCGVNEETRSSQWVWWKLLINCRFFFAWKHQSSIYSCWEGYWGQQQKPNLQKGWIWSKSQHKLLSVVWRLIGRFPRSRWCQQHFVVCLQTTCSIAGRGQRGAGQNGSTAVAENGKSWLLESGNCWITPWKLFLALSLWTSIDLFVLEVNERAM